jgi:dihydropteroate synthase
MSRPAEPARSGVADAHIPLAADHGLPAVVARPLGYERAVTLRCSDGTPLVVGAGRCAVMGIVNLTPDSFADGGRYLDSDRALARIDELIGEGAEIIDVGAESTRPGARLLSAEEEWSRLRTLVPALGRRRLKVVLSLDTRHLSTAARAADAGFTLLNLTFPQELCGSGALAHRPAGSTQPTPAGVLRAFDGLVVMHSRGTPATMRQLTEYGPDLCNTVITELADVVSALLDTTLRERVIYDPGLGFAKTTEQSLQLLGQIGRLRAALGGPLLIGVSRKSVLGSVTGLPVEERLVPSVVAATLAAQQGAAIVRVHDVAATRAGLQIGAAIAAAARGGR